MLRRYFYRILWFANLVWVVGITLLLCFDPPIRVIHPDALNFLSLFQVQYDQMHTLWDWPRHFFSALSSANAYDLHRGRIFNYLGFALEAWLRGRLPFAHFAWLTWVLQLANACLLGRWLWLYSKASSSASKEIWVIPAMSLALLLNQNLIYGSTVHFIYSKYVVVTFILLYHNFQSKPWRGVALGCAMFTDEIGLFYCMFRALLAVFEKKIVTQGGVFLLLRSLFYGGMAALGFFLFYHGFLWLCFGELPQLIMHQSAYGVDRGALLAFWRWLSRVAAYTLSGFTLTSAVVLVIVLFDFIKNFWRKRRTLFSQGVPSILRSDVFSAWVLIFFCTYIYRGRFGTYAYYTYPVVTLIVFLLGTYFLQFLNHWRGKALAVFVLVTLFLRVPWVLEDVRARISQEYFPDGTVSAKQSEDFFVLLEKFRGGAGASPVQLMNNHQELRQDRFTYSGGYFPVQAMTQILTWPKPLKE